MHVYIILLIFTILLFVVCKNKKTALCLSFILITLIAALRKYSVGIDTASFYNAFERIANSKSWNYLDFRFEPGFYYLCKILSLISKNPQILIVFTSIFINVSVYHFIRKYSSNTFMSTILYILMNVFFSYMNVMREALAITILLYGFEFLLDKKYIKYIFFVIIASFFHTAAFASIIALIYFVLPPKRISYFVEILIAIITYIFYASFFNILSSTFGYSNYANGVFGMSNYFGALIVFLENIIIFSILFLFASGKEKVDFNKRKMEVLTVITIVYLWFEFLTLRMVIFNRIYGLFIIYSIITIPELLNIIKKKNIFNYKVLLFVVFGVFFSSFIVIGALRPEWYGAIPYYFYWD